VREHLQPYKGPNRFNFLCILATELLGAGDLRDLPSLLAGFDSVLCTLSPNVATAIRNLRLDQLAPITESDVRLLVQIYQAHHARQRLAARLGGQGGNDQGQAFGDTRRYANQTLPLWSDGPDDEEPTGSGAASSGETRTPARSDRDDDDFAQLDGIAARFIIDERLNVRKGWTHVIPDDVKRALQSLTTPLPVRMRPQRLMHDPSLQATVRHHRNPVEAVVEPLGFIPTAPPMADVAVTGKAPGIVRWADLALLADRFDGIDVEAGRQSPGMRSWWRRLHTAEGEPIAELMRADAEGLVATPSIELVGIKHLIGLPGAGKTTLLYLLAAWMHERGYRVCFLFPSIEVSSAFVETLARYGIDSALLFGQSDRSRSKHVANFASAVGQDNRGYGVTRANADFFATNCALAGYASEEDLPFPHDLPPCGQVIQRATDASSDVAKGRKVTRARMRQCALSSVCGRQYAERKLATASVWAGHVLSTDREVSPLFSTVKMRQFEYLARTFDLVVVDECDGAQQNLDARGTPLLKLSGDADSVWNRLLMDLHAPAAQGRNAFVAGANIPNIMAMSGRYGIAAERLTAAIIHAPDKFRKEMANKLLTAVSLLAEMYPDPREEAGWEREGEESEQARDARSEQHRQKLQAIETVWQQIAKRVAYRSGMASLDDDAEDDDHRDGGGGEDRRADGDHRMAQHWLGGREQVAKMAATAGIASDDLLAYTDALFNALDRWDRDATEPLLMPIVAHLRQAPGLTPLKDEVEFFEYARLLSHVSLLVFQHFGLAPHLRLLNAQGILGDDVFESRPSREFLALVPESLVGRLSGVRYTVGDEGDVDISHVGVAGTPRLLVRRMLELGHEKGQGPAILMTSATSMLAPSPSFHVHEGPHYVLRRPNAGDAWSRSRYEFLPMKQPQDSRKSLFFSGARLSQREQILQNMVDQLLADGELGQVESAIAQNDVHDGVRRKAAFVVNSYDQCRLVYDQIRSHHPSWRSRVRVLVRGGVLGDAGVSPEHAITASEVERLGDDDGWDLFVFPMSAIGRGVNVVFRRGPRAGRAMLGSVFFLTRPHPKTDSLSFLQGIVARESEAFERQRFRSLPEALRAMRQGRSELAFKVRQLLRMQQSARSLGPYAEEFVADQMIMILQSIGRAMRGDCPAFIYFVDAAWAPMSAIGQKDTPRTSMLLMMREILRKCIEHEQPAIRACYENLYRTFFTPLSQVQGVQEEGVGADAPSAPL
jgi:hypothetical protein